MPPTFGGRDVTIFRGVYVYAPRILNPFSFSLVSFLTGDFGEP